MTKSPLTPDLTVEFADVFALYPAEMHKHVTTALRHEGASVAEGTTSLQTLREMIEDFAKLHEETVAHQRRAQTLILGIQELIANGTINQSRFVTELSAEIELGEASALYRFIGLQDLTSPLDAAVSFLAWNHARALSELENEFDVNLDGFRDPEAADLLGATASELSLVGWSVFKD